MVHRLTPAKKEIPVLKRKLSALLLPLLAAGFLVPTGTAPAAPAERTAPAPAATASFAATNGQLKVCGVKLCNKNRQAIQLRGMSTHGLQWYRQCVNDASLDALAGDWGASVMRISMYVQEGGYETDPAGYTNLVSSIIDKVTARGMYAIVDWHMLTPGDPNVNLARARRYAPSIQIQVTTATMSGPAIARVISNRSAASPTTATPAQTASAAAIMIPAPCISARRPWPTRKTRRSTRAPGL